MDLFKAIQSGDIDAVQNHLASGGNVNVEDEDGYTAVNMAAIMGHARIVDVLKKAGAQTDIFVEAAIGNSNAVIEYLNNGVDVNAVNPHGHQVLMIAAHQGHADMVRYLIKVKANVNARHQFSGNTALIGAAFQGHDSVVKILINAGTDYNATNNDERTALAIAQAQGHTGIVKMLEAAGAKK